MMINGFINPDQTIDQRLKQPHRGQMTTRNFDEAAPRMERGRVLASRNGQTPVGQD